MKLKKCIIKRIFIKNENKTKWRIDEKKIK